MWNQGQRKTRFLEAVVIGGSAGATQALVGILSRLPSGFPLPILVVTHIHPSDDGSLAIHLGHKTRLDVLTPCDKQPIEPGRVFVAPADYHMLVEREKTIALSLDAKVRWSRPSIDVLFESAARAYGAALCGVLLSGANQDGAQGLRSIAGSGGLCVVQSPDSSECPVMPMAGMKTAPSAMVLSPEEIALTLLKITECNGSGRSVP